MLPLEWLQDFTKIWPSDLPFDLIPSMFQLDQNIIKINILSKYDEDWVKIIAPRVVTTFY